MAAEKHGLSILQSCLDISSAPNSQSVFKGNAYQDSAVVLCLSAPSDEYGPLLGSWLTDLAGSVHLSVVEELNPGLESLRREVGDADRVVVLREAIVAPDTLRRLLDIAAEASNIVYCNELLVDDSARVVGVTLKPGYSNLTVQNYDYLARCYAFHARILRDAAGSRESVPLQSIAAALAAHTGSADLQEELFYIGLATRPDGPQVPSLLQSAVASVSVHPAPRISVIIPTRDRWDLVKPCLESLESSAGSVELEYILVDNGSTDPVACTEMKRWAQEGSDRILLRDDRPFNWSALNNVGASLASCETLLFLNNDTEIHSAGAVENLYRALQLPGVGVCGPQLLYPDRSIQHAGIVLGFGGAADHLYRGATLPIGFTPFLSPTCSREVSAVTGAALMVRSAAFALLAGFDESYSVTGSDVDFCLRARGMGLRTFFCADSIWIHHESKTRSNRDPKDDVARLMQSLVDNGHVPDPHFSQLLSLHSLYPLLKPETRIGTAYVRSA